MRTDNLAKIKDALTSNPQTLLTLMHKTGLARNTVRTGLEWLGADVVPDSYPIAYRNPPKAGNTGPSTVNVPSITKDADRVMVGLTQPDDWAVRWNNAKALFAKQIMGLKIEPGSDPKAMADVFAGGARTLASLAYALQNVADRPDWFVLLGGELEPDTP